MNGVLLSITEALFDAIKIEKHLTLISVSVAIPCLIDSATFFIIGKLNKGSNTTSFLKESTRISIKGLLLCL